MRYDYILFDEFNGLEIEIKYSIKDKSHNKHINSPFQLLNSKIQKNIYSN